MDSENRSHYAHHSRTHTCRDQSGSLLSSLSRSGILSLSNLLRILSVVSDRNLLGNLVLLKQKTGIGLKMGDKESSYGAPTLNVWPWGQGQESRKLCRATPSSAHRSCAEVFSILSGHSRSLPPFLCPFSFFSCHMFMNKQYGSWANGPSVHIRI